MDSHRLDPRRPGYDPNLANKRPGSRSPDNAPPRKAPRQNGDGIPIPRNPSAYTHDPRRQSTTGANIRSPGSDGRPINRPRRPSTQLQSELGNTIDTSMVSSPDSVASRRSRYEDAPSGRSTPISANGIASQRDLPVPPITAADGNNRQSVDVDPAVHGAEKLLCEKLMGAFDHVAAISQSLASRNQAAEVFGRASIEYDNMKPQFLSFPIIKEQKTLAKTQAEARLKACEERAKNGRLEQQRLSEELAAVFGQALIAAKPTEAVRGEYVPRSDLVALETRLKANISSTENRSKKLEEQSEGLKLELKKSTASNEELAKKAREEIAASEGLKHKLEEMISSVERRTMEMTEKMLKSSEDRINAVEKQEKLNKAQLDTSQANLSSAREQASSTITKACEQFEKKLDEACQTRCHKLYKGGQDIVADLAAVKTRVGKLEGQVQARNPDGPAAADTTTPIGGLGPIMSRLDKLVNDIHGKEGFMAERDAAYTEFMDGIVKDLDTLKERLDTLSKGSGASATPGMLDDLKHELKEEIKSRQQSTDNGMSALGTRIAARPTRDYLEQELTNITKQLAERATTESVDDSMNLFRIQLNGKAERSDLEDLKRDVNKVKDDQQGYANGVEAVLTELHSKADQSALEDHVTKLQHKMKSFAVAPQTMPQTNVVSSVTGSNGGHPEFRAGLRSVNNLAQANRAPVAQSPNMEHVLAELKSLKERDEVLTVATDTIQNQYNNLTTDVVVQAMADQMSEMYPDAKNFQKAIENMNQKFDALDQRLGTVTSSAQETIKTTLEKMKSDYQDLENQRTLGQDHVMRNGAQPVTASEASPHQNRVTHVSPYDVDSRLDDLDKRVSTATKRADEAVRITRASREAVDKTSTTLQKLEKNLELTVLSVEFDKAKADFNGLSTKVDGHDSTLRTGETAIRDLDKEIKRLKGEFANQQARINALAQVLD